MGSRKEEEEGRKEGRDEECEGNEQCKRATQRKPLKKESAERSNENLSIKPTSYQIKHEAIFHLSTLSPDYQ
jgi:hypothetical protein